MRRLLLEDLGKDTLELAADALFPLVLSHMSAFQSIGECSFMDICASVKEIQDRDWTSLISCLSSRRNHIKFEINVFCAGEKLLASQQDTAAQSALVMAMHQLLTDNGIENTVDRVNKRRFRANLTKFVVEARSIVRLR